MSEEEQEALLVYLRTGRAGSGLNPEQERVFVNDAFKALRLQRSPSPNLSRTLIAAYRDRSEDVVLRDYAIQHLGLWYADAPDRVDIQHALWEATKETDSTIAGTALLALHRLSETFSEIDTTRLNETASRFVMDEQVVTPVRLTALQVCTQRGLRGVLPAAVELAQSARSIPLRASAVAAIGTLGDARDITFLETLADDASEPLKPAVQAALGQLTNRMANRS